MQKKKNLRHVRFMLPRPMDSSDRQTIKLKEYVKCVPDVVSFVFQQ